MDNVLESIIECNDLSINPTIIFNEGWMTRLLVYYSVKRDIKIGEIDFGDVKNWTSEALISSPFIKAKKMKEGYTHTDIAFGDFEEIEFDKRGELKIKEDAQVFGVIEAKMKNNLSQRTSNFNNYNQASRNVVCIANNILNTNCNGYFFVVAPESMIIKHGISNQIEKSNILKQVKNRFDVYDDEFRNKKNYKEIVSIIRDMKIMALSYEDWIKLFKGLPEEKKLNDFYKKCLKWNRIEILT
jgi:hypothetical protein